MISLIHPCGGCILTQRAGMYLLYLYLHSVRCAAALTTVRRARENARTTPRCGCTPARRTAIHALLLAASLQNATAPCRMLAGRRIRNTLLWWRRCVCLVTRQRALQHTHTYAPF